MTEQKALIYRQTFGQIGSRYLSTIETIEDIGRDFTYLSRPFSLFGHRIIGLWIVRAYAQYESKDNTLLYVSHTLCNH